MGHIWSGMLRQVPSQSVPLSLSRLPLFCMSTPGRDRSTGGQSTEMQGPVAQ